MDSTVTHRIAVTGASGYIGRSLVSSALRRGWGVRVLTRSGGFDDRVQYMPYFLEKPVDLAALDGVDTLIHLAADTTSGDEIAFERDLSAAKRLMEVAKATQTRVLFVSSQTARRDAPTFYGRSKYAIEQVVLGGGGLVVRPGLVYGREERGLFGTICRIVDSSPILPDFFPRPHVQPIHVDDLSAGLLEVCIVGISGRIYCLGAPESMTFGLFLKLLAHYRFYKLCMFVPVPIFGIIGVMSIANRLVGPVFDAGKLRSLAKLPHLKSDDDIELLKVDLRPLYLGVHKSGDGKRRLLLKEAQTMLHYILGAAPPRAMVKQYVRCVEDIDRGRMLMLSGTFHKLPGLMSMLETVARTKPAPHIFNRRMELATLVAEASVVGAKRFILLQNSKANVVCGLAKAGLAEVFWRIGAFLSRPWMKAILERMELSEP